MACPEAGATDSGTCELCQTEVHDLSAMTEREARSFLAERAGQQLCISYRVVEGREIRFRSPRRPAREWVGALTTSALVGCASWGPESIVEGPEDDRVCEPGDDAESCEWSGPYPQPCRTEAGDGCEVGEASDLMSRLEDGVDPARTDPIAPVDLDPASRGSDAASDDEAGEARTVRLDFEIDPRMGFRGVVVAVEPAVTSGARLAYQPTEDLVQDFRSRWKKRIARWKTRRADRKRR